MQENEVGVTTENQSGENVDTTATNTQSTDVNDVPKQDNAEIKTETEVKPKRTFTEEEVNKIMQKRVNRSHQSFYDRYKAKDLNELDEKFASIETLTNEKNDLLKEKETLSIRNQELVEKLAFIENDINPERSEDVKAYFKGKGIIFNDENLKTELATHPEWKNLKTVDNTPVTTIKDISPTRAVSHGTDEKEAVAKLFGLQKII